MQRPATATPRQQQYQTACSRKRPASAVSSGESEDADMCPVDFDEEEFDCDEEWFNEDDDCDVASRAEIDRLIREELDRMNGVARAEQAAPQPPPSQRPKYCQPSSQQRTTQATAAAASPRPQPQQQQQRPASAAAAPTQTMGQPPYSGEFNVVELRHAAQLSQMLACSKDRSPNTVYVVVFHKQSCPACINYRQNHALALHAANRDVTFAYIDVNNPEFRPYIQQFGVSAVPSFVFVRGCKSYGVVAGFKQDELLRKLAQVKAAPPMTATSH